MDRLRLVGGSGEKKQQHNMFFQQQTLNRKATLVLTQNYFQKLQKEKKKRVKGTKEELENPLMGNFLERRSVVMLGYVAKK